MGRKGTKLNIKLKYTLSLLLPLLLVQLSDLGYSFGSFSKSLQDAYLMIMFLILLISVASSNISINSIALIFFLLLLTAFIFATIFVSKNGILLSEVFRLLICWLIYALTAVLIAGQSTQAVTKIMRDIISLTCLCYVCAQLANVMLGGQSLLILYQNTLPWLLFPIMFLNMERSEKIKMLLAIFFSGSIMVLSTFYFKLDFRIQFKSILMIALIFKIYLIRYIYLTLSNKPNWFRMFVSLILLAMLAISLLEALKLFWDLIGVEGLRRASSLQRAALAREMFSLDSLSFFSLMFGNGLTTSDLMFDYRLGNVKSQLPSHSGILSLLYEHGALAVVWFVVLLFYFRKTRNIENEVHCERSKIFYLIIFFWFTFNLIYLSAIPNASYFHLSNSVIFFSCLKFAKRANAKSDT